MRPSVYCSIDWLRISIGPAPLTGPLTDIPSEAFMTGILFPKASTKEPSTTPDVLSEVSGKDEANTGTTAKIDTAARPAAAGLSFALATRDGEIPCIAVEVTGARFEDERETLDDDDAGASRTRRVWLRRAVSTEMFITADENDNLNLSDNGAEGFDGLRLTVVQSRFNHGAPDESARLVTVVVHNEGPDQTGSLDRYEQNRQALFEFRMTIRADDGSRLIGCPLRSGSDVDDADEQSANLLWRDSVEYAVGHTCASTWSPQDCGKACNKVPQRGRIGDQVDPPSFVVETHFHQATTERPAGLICVEKIGLARRRLPLTAHPSRNGSELSADYGTPLRAD